MSHFNYTQASRPTDSGRRDASDSTPQSTTHNQQSLSVNRSEQSDRYKSELCRDFRMGKCHRRENCLYSHDDNECFLRKTKLCPTWERFGSCSFGERCVFAHGNEELEEAYTIAEMENFDTSSLELNPIGTNTAKKLNLQGKSCFSKWDIKKMSQIYADWIDDK